jgi:hypothetical protein
MKNIIGLASCLVFFTLPNIASAENVNLNNSSQQLSEESSEQDIKVVHGNGIIYKMYGCTKQSNTVNCSFLLTSDKDKIGVIGVGSRGTRFIDFNGNEYYSSYARIGNESSGGNGSVSNELIRGIPIKASISFDNIPENVNQFATLELHEYVTEIRFDNISISNKSTDIVSDVEDSYTSNSDRGAVTDNVETRQRNQDTLKDISNTVKDIKDIFKLF